MDNASWEIAKKERPSPPPKKKQKKKTEKKKMEMASIKTNGRYYKE